MSREYKLLITLLLAVAVTAAVLAQNKPKDSYGRVDKVDVSIRPLKGNQFAFELNWDNDEKLAALTFPLIVKGRDFKVHYDSVSWEGRAKYFSVKSVRPIDSLQKVLVGMVYDLGQGNPPLNEGKGTVATLYFTADGKGKAAPTVCDITVDTTFIGPSNVLYGVTMDGTGTVHPAYGVSRKDAAGLPAPCKELRGANK